jgi:phenylalanyl-tRNA synthetase beta chain
MRTSLMGSLLAVLKYNQDRKATNVRVFELGRVFLRDESAVDSDTTVKGLNQPLRVAGLASGDAAPAQWGAAAKAVDFFDVRADVEALFAPRKLTFKPEPHPALHPGRSARIYAGDTAVGFVGELHPKWKQTYGLAAAPVLFELDLAAVLERDLPKLEAVPKTPFVQRDLAVVVKESVTHAALMAAVHSTPLDAASKPLLRGAALFDIYRAKATDTSMAQDEKSLAVRLTLGSDEQTLQDAQIEVITSAITAQLAAQLNARLR